MRYILATCLLLFTLLPSAAHAVCTSPAGTEGEQIYNTTHKTMQFCDGTNWVAMKGGAGGGAGAQLVHGVVARGRPSVTSAE